MNEKLANYIRQGDHSGYLKERYPAIADYEELVFINEDFHDVDWRKFPSSMNVFKSCNLDDLILPPGQPIKIENCSARGMDISGITAIIHAIESDFSGLKYNEGTVLADSKDASNIPSTFEKCIFDEETKAHFAEQGVVFKDQYLYMKKTVAKALIQDIDGDMLFLQRSYTHPNFPGHLDLPGGEIENGENFQEAIIREVHEQTGICFRNVEITELFQLEHPEVTHILVKIKSNNKNANITLSWEHKSYEWLCLEEVINRGLDSSMDSYYKDVFTYLKNLSLQGLV